MVARGWIEWRESICVYKGAAGGSPVVTGQFRVWIADMVTQNCMCDKISQDCTNVHKQMCGRLLTCRQTPGWPVCCSHGERLGEDAQTFLHISFLHLPLNL